MTLHPLLRLVLAAVLLTLLATLASTTPASADVAHVQQWTRH